MLPYIIAVAVLLVGVCIYLAATGFFTQTTFLTAYKLEFQRSGSPSNAVEAGLRVFHGRPPFDQLSEYDIKELARILGMVPDAMAAAALVRRADRARDASELKSREFRNRMEHAFQEMREVAKPAAGNPNYASNKNNEKSKARQRHLASYERIFNKPSSTSSPEANNHLPGAAPNDELTDKVKTMGLVKDVTNEMICVNVIDDPMLGIETTTEPAELLDAMIGGLFVRQEFWRIGVNIPQDICSKLKDPESGELYGIVRLKEGRKAVQLLPKSLWDVARQTINQPL